MRRSLHLSALIAAIGGLGASTGVAHAGTFICVPPQAGVAVVSGGPNGTCDSVSTPVQLPSSAADQQTLLSILPYVKFSAAGLPNSRTTTTNNPLITFKGVNVLVKKGDGAAGTGNLLVGNQDLLNPATRTGSDNLIVGNEHSWTGHTNLVAGNGNRANGNYSLLAGLYNTASSGGNVAFGGYNTVGEQLSTVLGGAYNSATGNRSTVLGGTKNSATGSYSAVLGGSNRTATASESVIADGAPKSQVHWAKTDSTGKLISSSDPGATAYASSSYALVQFPGVDLAKCAVTVQSAEGKVTDTTWSDWYGYVYARSTQNNGQTGQNVPYDIIAACDK
jgi:hypothetical protein